MTEKEYVESGIADDVYELATKFLTDKDPDSVPKRSPTPGAVVIESSEGVIYAS